MTMGRLAKISIYALGVLAAIGAVSISLGAPATLVQILNGSSVVSTGNPLPVTGTFAPSGTTDVNLKQVNGATTTAFGSGVVGTETQRVVLATDVTSPVKVASGQIASGAIASGAVASGAVASGAYASGSISDGAEVTLGAKADARSTSTDTTAITVMQVLKEISFMEQTPASRAVTNAGTFAVQATGTFFQATQPVSIASGQVASGAVASGAIASGALASGAFASGSVGSGAIASGAIASGAVASGAYASGSISDGADVTQGAKADAKSTSTDTTAITVMQVLKEISFMEQTPASRAVTNAGTFAVQATPAVSTSGGVTTYVLEPAASDNHAVVKAGAGNVYWITAFNNSATINYIRLYNATTGFNGCNSATNLVYEGHIPASTSDAGFTVPFPAPISFATGISICVTGAYGQTSTTNATASAMSITIGYN